MAEKKLLVPNIGDFKNVEVIEVLVKSGQQIKKNDPLITLESDKSSVEVPATDEGKINKIIVKVGDKVSEGSEILSLDSVSKKEESKKICLELIQIFREIKGVKGIHLMGHKKEEVIAEIIKESKIS